MSQKKKSTFQIAYWQVRLGLTIVVLLVCLFTFFLGNGMDFFKQAVSVKAFDKLPFEIHFIDVGQGDSIFMRFPNDKTMLVDCGPNDSNNTVVSYLTDLFDYEHISAIDYMVLTHQDADHVGKAAELLKTFQVNTVYRPKVLASEEAEKYGNPMGYKTYSTITYNNAIKAIYNEPNCEMIYSEKGIEIYDSDFKVEFLSPELDSYPDNNNYSPVIMVTYQSRKFLLTGDAEGDFTSTKPENFAENEVVKNYGNYLKADVLKVGHHGSHTSSTAEFLSYVLPEYAVISVGANNKYGHPRVETLGRLEAVNAKILETSRLGSIVMSVDSRGNIVLASGNENFRIDVPLLFAFTVVVLILIWSIKVKTSNKVKNKQKSS